MPLRRERPTSNSFRNELGVGTISAPLARCMTFSAFSSIAKLKSLRLWHVDGRYVSARLDEREGDDARSRCHGDVLLAVEHVRHRRRFPRRIRLKLPERRAARRIDGHQRAAVFAEKNKPARPGQRAAPGVSGTNLREVPRNRACPDVYRP